MATDDDSTTKRCSKCGETRPSTQFSRDKNRADGLYPQCNPCRKAAYRAYYLGNRVSILEKNAVWAKNNPASIKRSTKKWGDANRDHLRDYNNRYRAERPGLNADYCRHDYAKNKAARLAGAKKWRSENKELAKAISSAWRAANREVLRLHHRLRKARLKGAEGTHRVADIEVLFREQAGLCVYCKTSLRDSGFHVDHIRALARGGSNWPANLQLLCPSCNMRKWAKSHEDFARENGPT